MQRARILIADDHEMVRQGLRRVLESRLEWEICAEARTGREALELACKLKPDIVVLDLSMPDLNGLEAARQIRKALPQTEVLILTVHDAEQLIRHVISAGARGYVLKSDAGTVLVRAIESLTRHELFFTSKISDGAPPDHPADPSGLPLLDPAQLTPRERQILQLIAEGKSSKEVASALNIRLNTVETHRANLMCKLHLHSVSELVHYAIRNNLVRP